MIIKGLITEDFVNYKKVSMTIMFPHCDFKCGAGYCQNSPLAKSENINVDIDKLVEMYVSNPISEAVVMQGLEPFNSWEDLQTLVKKLREKTDDDIVIYTGFDKKEIKNHIEDLKEYGNIVVKFGRYIPNDLSHFDELLGVNLASNNQYAERIC